MRMDRVLFVILSLFCLNFSSVFGYQCLDSDGKPVDWYSSYKIPKLRGKSSLFALGLAHYYLDVASPSWTLSQRGINATGTAVYNTLQQVYKSKLMNNSADFMYVMYNDEHPDGRMSDRNGHAKGVFAFSKNSGFWLIHSVPKFPPFHRDGFSYPQSGTRFGQSFLCISFPSSMIGSIAKQLVYNEVNKYDWKVPVSYMNEIPSLRDLMANKKPQGPPWYNVVDIQSLRGQKFTSFAKATHFGRDLYKDLVAPSLKKSLLVETWMDGGGQLATNCSGPYKVINAIRINLPGDVLVKRTRDHSKWATAFTSSSFEGDGEAWTCVGDINRMYAQYKRGGGTLCLNNLDMWKAFRQSVVLYEKCGKLLP